MAQLQRPTDLPTGLAAMVALQRAAAATTSDGAPTIAALMAKQAGGEMPGQGQGQEQPQAPQGIAGIAPNLPPQAQNAAIGAQIKQGEEEKAKQTMMQMAQQQAAAQKPPGPLQLAHGGIAGLPADNMHNMGRYARGGVLGFAGDKPERSEVPELSEAEKNAKEEAEAKQILMDQLDLMRFPAAAADVVQAPIAGLANLGGSALSGIQNFSNRAINALMGSKKLPTDKDYNPNYSLTPFYDKIRAAEEKANKTTVDIPEVKQPAPERDANGLIIQDPAAQAPAPAPATLNKGLGNLVRQADTAARPAAVVKPAAGAPQNQTAKVPDAITAPNIPTLDETELTKLLAESKALRAGRTDFEGENIKGIETAEAKRKALEASRVGSSAIDRLIAATANAGYRPGGAGSRVAAYDEKQQQLAQMNLQAETLAAANVRAQKELAYNVKIGDNAAAMQSQKELSTLRQKQAEIGTHAAGQQYVAQMQARSDELRQMGEDRRNAATNKAHLQAASLGQEDQRRISALATQIARNAGRPEDAFDYVSAVEYIARAKAGPKTDIASQAQALKEQALYEKGKGIADKYNNPTEYERRMRDFAIRAGGSAGGGEGGGGGGGGGFTYVGPAGGK